MKMLCRYYEADIIVKKKATKTDKKSENEVKETKVIIGMLRCEHRQAL